MFYSKIIAKAMLCLIIAFGASTSSYANENLFNSIFGDDGFSHEDSTRSFKDPNYVFSAPHFSRRAKGRNTLTAKVDLSEQTMEVYINGSLWQEWRISSGARGYRTPTGRFKPTRLHAKWFSRTYDNTPMPHSVFFHYGYAIHATLNVRGLGRPRSHGCVRLHPQHAKAFFELIQDFGKKNTSIIITQ